MWALLVGHRPERWRPPTAGALAGVLAHPPMWAMVSLVVGQEVGMAPAEQATGAFVSAALFSVFSMIIYGPLTVLAGALVGWLLGRTGLAPGVQPRPATHPR